MVHSSWPSVCTPRFFTIRQADTVNQGVIVWELPSTGLLRTHHTPIGLPDGIEPSPALPVSLEDQDRCRSLSIHLQADAQTPVCKSASLTS